MIRKRLVLVGASAVAALVIGACAGGAPASTSKPAAQQPAAAAKVGDAAVKAGDAAKGKDAFGQTCSACHGPAGQGMPGLGKDFTTSEFVKAQTDAQLLDFVKKGRPSSDPLNTTKVDMPPKGGNPAMTDAQIMDIIAYIRTIQK